MTTRPLFCGVDGGGTKTEFLCIDGERRVVARAIGGPSYHLQVGVDGVAAVLDAGLGAICRDLSLDRSALSYCFFGLPAFGEDRQVDPELTALCGRLLGHDRYRCGNDMICGWAGSLGGEDGINLVAGTGSIGYGERNGRRARVGGWSEVFSDEGSAYWIAIRGLNAFTRMSDGRLPRGPLHQLLTEALGLEDDLDLCARIMGDGGMPRDEIAALARIVSRAAEVGDPAASAILVEAAAELAAMAHALRDTLGYPAEEPARFSWSGGVLAAAGPVRRHLRAALEAAGRYLVMEPLHPPSYGAALYAAKLSAADPQAG